MELLRKVQAHILAHPEEFDMDYWICGTTACIAGHAALMSGYRDGQSLRSINWLLDAEGNACSPIDAGASVLDVNPDQADRLFFIENWPPGFREPYVNATEREEIARAASDRIDHFIATDGRE